MTIATISSTEIKIDNYGLHPNLLELKYVQDVSIIDCELRVCKLYP